MVLTNFKSIPLPVAQLSLAAVLRCGQSFRWHILVPHNSTPGNAVDSAEYHFCLKDRVVCLRQSLDTLYYRAVFPDPQPTDDLFQKRDEETLHWLIDYFQLKVDLLELYKQWTAKDKVFARFQERFEGIRILRQDPWENLVSFICSSNNNISRITKMVQSLATNFSPPLLSLLHPFSPEEVITYHPFPPPSALAAPGIALQLRSLGFGYRANYIQRTAQMLVKTHVGDAQSDLHTPEASELWLRRLRQSTTAEAREELLKFVGIGRKVADCILLMSLDKKEVVPVDTHVYQIAVKYYGMKGTSGKTTMTPKLYEEVNAKFLSIWGEYAGWAHTVLFTADLKSFASYGLPTPSPTPSRSSSVRKARVKTTSAKPTPQLTPGTLSLKRKEARSERDYEIGAPASIPQLCDYSSLIDRVKRRRMP